MYPVLFNAENNIKLPRSRRREGVCQVLWKHIFKTQKRKTLVLRQIEVRIKFKKGKIVRRVRNRQVGEYLEAFTTPAENKRKV